MIDKQIRFTTRLFKHCFKRSKRIRAGRMSFLVSEDRWKKSHFSVVVSTSYSKKAVERNRLRRQMYEIIRKRVQPYVEGKNIICLYQGQKGAQDTKELQKDFFRLLSVLNRRNSSQSQKN